MIQRERMNGDEQTTVTFIVPAPAKGEKLSVASDFNGWDPGQLPMTKRGKKCTATAMLDTGRRHAFRYVSSDGRWFETRRLMVTSPTTSAPPTRSST